MSEKPDFEKLGDSAIGEELNVNECKALANAMRVRHAKDKEVLVNESGAEHTLFVLIEGHIQVSNVKEGKEQVVYTMNPGEVAGTRAFVDRSPRKATLRAKGKTTVYTLDPYDFEALLEVRPSIVYKAMRAIFKITHCNLLRMNQETEQLSNYINRTHGRY